MIRKIIIKRFRSIDELTIDCGRLTILVGPNDAGKSNVVRALNLFFNGRTNLNEPFDFAKDFNQFSTVGLKKAKEVEIIITFDLPKGFQRKGKSKQVKWRKIWRKEGFNETLSYQRYADKQGFEGRSKIPSHLRAHFLEYVPAIKDENFFAKLLGDIYDKLVESLSPAVSQALVSSNLSKQMETLTADLKTALGESFNIGLPVNLRPIFEALDIKNADDIPLDQRGDGIKIRHIPELLKFITEKTIKSHTGLGKTNSSHIWVFEEPENNLEIKRAFSMADRLKKMLESTENLQIFITTHSPVFYGLGDEENISDVRTHFITREEKQSRGETQKNIEYETIAQPVKGTNLDEEMGILPQLSKQTKELQQRAEQAESLIESMKENGVDFSHKTIFVEGKSDECVYQRTLELFFPESYPNILIKSPENGSAQAATDYLYSWKLRQRHKKLPRTKAVALLDDDEAAHAARNNSLPKNLDHKVKVFYLSPKGTTLQMYSKEFQPNKDLESLYPDCFWERAKQEGWLEKVDEEKIFETLPLATQKKIKSGEGTDRFYGLSENEKLRLEYQFNFKGKKKASQYIARCGEEEAKIILKDVESNLQEVVAWLNA